MNEKLNNTDECNVLDSWARKKDLLEIAWETKEQVENEEKLKKFNEKVRFHAEFADVLRDLVKLNEWYELKTYIEFNNDGEFQKLQIQTRDNSSRYILILPFKDFVKITYGNNSLVHSSCHSGYELQKLVVEIFQGWFKSGFKFNSNVKGFKNV